MFSEEVKEQLLEVSKAIGEMTEKATHSLNRFIESEEFKSLIDALSNLPKDVQETDLFKRTVSLHDKEISYVDACWLRDVIVDNEYYTRKPKETEARTLLDDYIIGIINSENMGKREKIVILLSHFESLVYQKINHTRSTGDKLRKVVDKRMKETHELSAKGIETIVIVAICFVVFSGTDYYQSAIDRRIPFRNEIIHNGTLAYNDKEIEEAYDILVDYIFVLLDVLYYKANRQLN